MKKATYKFGLKLINARYNDRVKSEKKSISECDNLDNWWIKERATNTFYKKFKAGVITPDEFKAHVLARAIKEIEKDKEKDLQALEAMKDAKEINSISISVTWAKNRTWGANPTATAYIHGPDNYDEAESRSVSGCGYDKRSAATAEALNKIISFKALLLDLCRIEAKTKNKTYGYNVFGLPSMEGGVGFECHRNIIEKMGFKPVVLDERAKNYDRYEFVKGGRK